MKNYILTLLFAFMALTSCSNDEYYYKTPGEVTGEKITELIAENGCMSQCFIQGFAYNGEYRSFSIEGQFLHLNAVNGWKAVSFDLNHLLRWQYVSNGPQSYFYFTFNTK